MIESIDIKKLKSDLLKNIEKCKKESKNKKFIRVEISIPSIDPLNWLHMQKDKTKIFFSGRDNDYSIAGIGITHIIQSSDNIDQNLLLKKMKAMLKKSNIKYYGGISFPEEKMGKEWRSFGRLKFIVPRFELIKKDRTYFACNILSGKELKEELIELEKDFDKLIFNTKHVEHKIEKPIERKNIPLYNKWKETIIDATDAIRLKKFNKIVLARKTIYKFKNKINPIDIIIRLKKNLFNRYDFLFQFEPGVSFLGSSMERLYKRVGSEIKSEGIAGSIERGKDEAGDKELSNKLLNSKKDNIEQDFVINFIQKKLSLLCSKLEHSNKEVLKLKESSHLKSEFNGYLKDNIGDIDLIKNLHPTPAVGGDPWDLVSKLISQYEPFSRGWYAGLIGYIGEDSADLSVALRSGLIYNDTLSLYAGVGIVEGSNPEKEWEEGNWKIKNYEEIFT